MAQSILDLILRTKKEGAGEKDVQKGLTDLVGLATKTAGVLSGAAVLMKKAFDFGEMGAASMQMEESFSTLMGKVGQTTGLLDELRAASKGTIDDYNLMASTATLLAGTQGELSSSLAEATPELMEIAKAAQKLNPTLGDTTFLYDSLARGIKRGSPLILDNLGIVLNLEEAYQKYADSIGVSKDALTKEQQQVALLNAVLEKGNVLIDQAGGTTDSATDAFARMETSIANTRRELAEQFVPVLASAAEGLNWILTFNEKVEDAFNASNQAVALSAETYDDYIKSIINNMVVTGKMTDTQAKWVAQANYSTKSLEWAGVTTHLLTVEQWKSIKTTAEHKAITDQMAEASRAASAANEEFADKIRIRALRTTFAYEEESLAARNAQLAAENLAAAQAALDQQYQDLQLAISGPIRSEMESFNEQQASLTERAEELRIKIEELEGQDYLTSAQEEQLEGLKGDLAEVTGKITENEKEHTRATKQIIFNLLSQRAAMDGMTSGELSLLNSLSLAWGLVDQATYDAVVSIDDMLTDMAEGESLESIESRMQDLLNTILGIEGDHKVGIDVSVTGDSVQDILAATNYHGNAPAQSYAEGGAFWATEPTRIMVGEGGEDEWVTVTPRSQMGPEQMNQTTINLYANYPPTDPASIDQDLRTLMFYYQTRSH